MSVLTIRPFRSRRPPVIPNYTRRGTINGRNGRLDLTTATLSRFFPPGSSGILADADLLAVQSHGTGKDHKCRENSPSYGKATPIARPTERSSRCAPVIIRRSRISPLNYMDRPDQQKASFTIPPYYWLKDASYVAQIYRLPAEMVLPWMDPKLDRCKGKNGWGE
jgi:hypothetical protein